MPVLSGGKLISRSAAIGRTGNQPRRKKRRTAARKKQSVLRDWQLYELELEDGFYYVGISTDSEVRFDQHYLGAGARWTALHRPKRILRTNNLLGITKLEATQYETDRTVELIREHGVLKVRGGKLCAVDDRVHARMYSTYVSKRWR